MRGSLPCRPSHPLLRNCECPPGATSRGCRAWPTCEAPAWSEPAGASAAADGERAAPGSGLGSCNTFHLPADALRAVAACCAAFLRALRGCGRCWSSATAGEGSRCPEWILVGQDLVEVLAGRSCCRQSLGKMKSLCGVEMQRVEEHWARSRKNKTQNVCFRLDLERFPSDKPGHRSQRLGSCGSVCDARSERSAVAAGSGWRGQPSCARRVAGRVSPGAAAAARQVSAWPGRRWGMGVASPSSWNTFGGHPAVWWRSAPRFPSPAPERCWPLSVLPVIPMLLPLCGVSCSFCPVGRPARGIKAPLQRCRLNSWALEGLGLRKVQKRSSRSWAGSSAAPGQATLSECLSKEQDLDIPKTTCGFYFFPQKSLPWLSNLQPQAAFPELLSAAKQRLAVSCESWFLPFVGLEDLRQRQGLGSPGNLVMFLAGWRWGWLEQSRGWVWSVVVASARPMALEESCRCSFPAVELGLG